MLFKTPDGTGMYATLPPFSFPHFPFPLFRPFPLHPSFLLSLLPLFCQPEFKLRQRGFQLLNEYSGKFHLQDIYTKLAGKCLCPAA